MSKLSWAAPYTGAEPLPHAVSPSLPRTSVGPPGGGQEPPHRPASPTLHLTSLLPSRGCGALDAPSRSTQGPAACSSLCGIDHEALNKQIMEYKRRKERGCRSESPAESPLTHTREGNVAATPCADGDLSRENHLSGAASGHPDPDLDGSRGAAGRAEVTEGRRGGEV